MDYLHLLTFHTFIHIIAQLKQFWTIVSSSYFYITLMLKYVKSKPERPLLHLILKSLPSFFIAHILNENAFILN